MEIIIDRIEENFAVAELPSGSFADVPLSLLPGVKEGDVVNIIIDREKTKVRSYQIQRMMEQIFKDDKEG